MRANFGFGTLAVRIHPDQIVRVGIVKLKPRTLVQHVGIDPVRTQQRHPLLALGALFLQARKLRGERDDLLVEFLPRVEPVLAGIGVDAEIADHRRRHRIEGKAGQDRFESGTGDHGRPCDGRVNGLLKVSSSWPGIAVRRTASLPLACARPSRSCFFQMAPKTWMPGTRPGMTIITTTGSASRPTRQKHRGTAATPSAAAP